MLEKSSPLFWAVATTSMMLFGCSSTTQDASADASTASSRDTSPSADGSSNDPQDAQDAGPCVVLPSGFDDSCTSASDCVLVPRGGDTCNACSNVTGALFCTFSSLSQAGAAKYLTALHAHDPAPDASVPLTSDGCRVGSCPPNDFAVTCQAGHCVTNSCQAAGGTCIVFADASADQQTRCLDNPYPCNTDDLCCLSTGAPDATGDAGD